MIISGQHCNHCKVMATCNYELSNTIVEQLQNPGFSVRFCRIERLCGLENVEIMLNNINKKSSCRNFIFLMAAKIFFIGEVLMQKTIPQ